MAELVCFTVNGRPVEVTADPWRRLLDVLREDLGLTGAKEGCGVGECGACSVLLDGEPVNACLVALEQVDGRDVVTVEGLGTPEHPHPLQVALVEEGGVQCGFCTPGMVVAGTAVLRDHPGASREELRRLMSGNTCRCTGYQQILSALERVAKGSPAEATEPDRVGARALRLDGIEKATGRVRYTADLNFPPECLHGSTVRATEVHARLLGVDVSAALALPGVVRVLTADDVPGELHLGNAIPDQPVLARDRIRFFGEAVAVVLAEDPATAREGAGRVRILTEPLQAVLDPERALEPGCVALHPAFPGTVKSEEGNLLCHMKLRKGDTEQGFGASDLVLERIYRTQAQEHLCLEPEAALALPDGEGGITVHAPSQNVFFDRLHLSRALGMPRERLHVIQAPTGAAFGGREDLYAQVHAALGALHTGRPVRIVWTREETQIATTKRHPARMRYRIGVRGDGTLLALSADILADGGAYASWSPNIARKMLVHAAGAYEIPNVRVDVRVAYTNNGFSGAFRGFGAPQVSFAVESILDEAARALGISPAEMRRRNNLDVGRITATGQRLDGSCGLAECRERALAKAEALALGRPPPARGVFRGRGMSTIFYGIGYGNAIPDIGSAVVELRRSGHFLVRCGAVDYGQGSRTTFLQIACEVLGVSRERLDVLSGDSRETPDSGSTVASRQTYVSGEAVRQAAQRLKDDLVSFVALRWGVDGTRVHLEDSGVWVDKEKYLCSLEELGGACEAAGVKASRQARNKASTTRLELGTGQGNAYWPYAFACHVADVEVDAGTGRVRVLSLIAAHDVGRVINPTMAEGQVIGGAAQGLGFALMEEHRLEEGVPRTRNLDTYRVPGFADVPEIVPILVEAPEPTGPFGAKGIGEPVLVAVAPAIANAVHDAIGVRIRELPLLPERILRALEELPRRMEREVAT
jgi:xanthine dehydrogenase molybdenum-binding subunit